MVKPGTPGKIILTAGQFSWCSALNKTPGWLKGSVLSLLKQGNFDHPKANQVVVHVKVYCLKHLVLHVHLI